MLSVIALVVYILILWILFLLARWDIREYILPNELNAALAVLFLVFHATTGWVYATYIDILLGAVTGGGLLLAIGMIASKYYGDDCLGFGDIKLMTAAGVGLGFPDVMMALSIGACLGMIHGVYIAHKHQATTGEKIPFSRINVPAGVGLSGGIFLVMLWKFGFDWVHIPGWVS